MKALSIQVALLAAIVISLFLLIDEGSGHNFTLEFHGMDSLDIEYIAIEGDVGKVLYLAENLEFDPIGEIRIDSYTAEASGYLSVSIHTSSGQTYSLNDMPFKTGETNYVIKNGTKLNYVKAHW